jgi:tetrahydromethanopterin S-methyltransferase subunit G
LYDLEIGCSVGADFGKLFGNSVGMLVSIKKRGNLFSY